MRPTPSIALATAAASLSGFALVRARVGDVHAWLGVANLMGDNDRSHVSAARVDELLGHVQMLLLGVAVLALVYAADVAGRARPRRLPAWLRRAAPFAVPAAVALAFGAFLVADRGVAVGGRRHFFLVDDAMTSMRYARNLAAGRGLVFNEGERVEGYSNFLWVLYMAAIHGLGVGPALAPMWVLAASLGCIAVTVCLVVDALRALGAGAGWCACAGLLVACDDNTLAWAGSGLETSALTAAVTACVWALVRRKDVAFAGALAAIPLLRADGVVLAAVLGAALARRDGARRALRLVAPAAALAAGHLVFRRAYYGLWLPNTYYLRMIDLGDRLRLGLGGYGARLALSYAPWLALVAVAARRAPRALGPVAAIVFLQAAYAIYVGGDIFPRLRFVAPVLPALYLSAAFAARGLAGGRGARVAQAALLLVCPVFDPSGKLGRPNDSDGFFRQSLARAEQLEGILPAGALVSVYPAGTVPYLAERLRFVDVFGKTDLHIAHAKGYAGLALGHDKFDFDYVYDARRPDVALIMAPCQTIEDYLGEGPAQRRATLDRTPFLKQVPLFDVGTATFARDYLPNRLPTPDPPAGEAPLDCAFARRGATVLLATPGPGPGPAEAQGQAHTEL